MLFIRPAALSEAEAIAKVHVQSWDETYQGMIPDHILVDNKMEYRTPYWAHFLRNKPEKTELFVAEFWKGPNKGVVGFGLAGPEKVGLTEYNGEVQALYLMQSVIGQGIGKRLMKAMAKYLIQQDLTKVCVWAVFENDRARRFYAKMGGDHVSCRYLELPPSRIKEAAYGWDHASQILEIA